MPDPAAQEALAAKLDRYSRHALLGVIPVVAFAGADLATDSLTGDHRIDYVMFAPGGALLYGAYLQRRLARRLRAGTLPQHATRADWLRAAVSIVASFAFSAGIGYAVGGWIVAVTLSAVTAILLAGMTVVGRRHRTRRTSI